MADFDPDAYLAQKTGSQSFDPDAYLHQKLGGAQAPAPNAGFGSASATGSATLGPAGHPALDAAGRGIVQGGTFGFGDEVSGALTAGQQWLAEHPAIQQGLLAVHPSRNGSPDLAPSPFVAPKDLPLQPITDNSGSQPAAPSELYRQARDEERAANAAAAIGYPKSFLAGSLLGGLATAKPLGALGSLGQAGRAGRLLQATTLGGLAGLGTSNSETPGGMAADALGITGAEHAAQDIGNGRAVLAPFDLLGAGALGGAGAGVTGEVAPLLVRGIGSKLQEQGIDQGRRALYNISQRLSARKEIPADAVQAVLESGAMPAGANSKTIARNLVGAAEDAGADLGGILDRAGELGVRVPVAPIYNELASRAVQAMPNQLSEVVPNIYKRAALAIMDRMGVGDDATADIRQAENLKRSAQETANSAYQQFKPSSVGQAHMGIASVLRQASEDALNRAAQAAPPTSELNDLAESFVPAKQRYANLAQARDLALVGKARGLSRTAGGLVGDEIAADGLRQIIDGNPTEGLKDFALKNAFQLYRSRGPSLMANLLYRGGKSLRQNAPLLASPEVSPLAALLQRTQQIATPKSEPQAVSPLAAALLASQKQ